MSKEPRAITFPKENRREKISVEDSPENIPATGEERQLVIKLAYNGAAFSGFAAQETAHTVAGDLLEALNTYLRRPCTLVCAGRTDAGVHAAGQVVSIPVSAQEAEDLSLKKVQQSLQALVSENISIRNACFAPADFSARFDALSRSYTYRIAQGARPILTAPFALWEKQPLALEAMQAGARYLVGEHDFRSFCKATSAKNKNTRRRILALSVEEECFCGERIIAFHIEGTAFLHNMVRIIVGTLMEVGRAKQEPHWIAEVLQAKDRQAAGPTVAPHGLCFEHVSYPASVPIDA